MKSFFSNQGILVFFLFTLITPGYFHVFGFSAEPGDADNNGIVEYADQAVIKDHILARNAAAGNPDANNDGVTDAADVIFMEINYAPPWLIRVTLPGDVKMEFVRIPAGSFLMGSDDETWSTSREQPVHRVNINYAFYLAKYEVTKEQWAAVMNTGSVEEDERLLAKDLLSWDECNAFITAINQLGTGTFRLPSEAEWEYAARGGSSARFHFGDSNCQPAFCEDCNLSQYAWWCNNNDPFGTKQTGRKLSNQYGLFDTAGNVWEWCRDTWHSSYEGAPADGSAWVDEGAILYVIKGGNWESNASECRPAYRTFQYFDGKDLPTGLRPVLATLPE